MSGKYGPKENSVMTCERFITAAGTTISTSLTSELNNLTRMVYMLVAGIAMSERGDM